MRTAAITSTERRAIRQDAARDRVWWLAPGVGVTASPEDPVATAIDTVFAPASGTGPLDGALRLASERVPGGGWRIFADGLPLTRARSLAELAPLIEGALVGYAVRNRADAAAFHAASVAFGDRAVLLIGDKGSGKSTLSLLMARAGAQLLGDEVAFVGFEDQRLRPFPKATTVKEGAFALFEDGPVHLDPVRGPVRYLSAGEPPPIDAHLPIDALILPRWDRAAPAAALAPMAPEEVSLELVCQSFGGLERDERTLEVVGALSHLPTWALDFSDGDAAVRAVRAALREGEGNVA